MEYEYQRSNANFISSTLSLKKDEIMDLWKSKICDHIPAAKHQTEAELDDSIPRFLDKLVQTLASDSPKAITFEEVNQISEHHGHQRSLLQKYTLQEMLEEYRLLREAIFETLEVREPLLPKDRDIILQSIEQGMAQAGERFVKMMQRREQHHESEYRNLLASIKDHAIIKSDINGVVTDWNKGAEKILGYTREEIIGKSASIIFIEEDLKEKADVEEMRTAEMKGRAEDERWHVRKDGSRFFANGILNPLFDEDQNHVGFVKVLRDQTEFMQIQNELKTKTAEYQSIFHAIPDAVIVASESRKILACNPAAERILGYRPDELLGKPTSVFYESEADYQRQGKERYNAKTDVHGVMSYTARYRRKNGDIIISETNATVLRDGNGAVRGYLAIMRDITDRLRAEDALKKSEEYQRQLANLRAEHLSSTEDARKELYNFFMQAPVALCVLMGPEHRFTLANPYFLKVSGRDPIGLTVREAFKHEEVSHFVEILDKVYESGEPFIGHEISFPRLDKEGNVEHLFVNFSYHPYRNEQGAITGILANVQDVTELVLARRKVEESERQFRRLADSMPQIVWVADANGFLTFHNERFIQYTGVAYDEAKGWDWQNVIHPQDLSRILPIWRRCLETGEMYEVELRMKERAGDYKWFLVRAVPIRDEEGKIKKWYGTDTEIQGQKRLSEHLLEERELREQFVATLTHDLRTPLTAAKLSAQFLKRKTKDPEAIEKIAMRISDNLERSDIMIRDLLDANRIRAGEKLPLELADCDVADVLRATLEELGSVHGERFVCKAPEHLECHVSCYGLRRVIENLCANAIKYGSPNAEVTVNLQDKKDHFKLEVHNWGVPIPPQELQLLFEPYRRSRSAERGTQKGWGLGLTLVKGITETHGGSVHVESSDEAGTIFAVTIPKQPKNTED